MDENFQTVQKLLEDEAKVHEEIQVVLKRLDMKGPQAALAAYLKSPKTVTPEKTLKELNQLVPVFEELSVGFPRKYHHFFDRNLQQWIYVHLMLHYIQTGTLLLFNDLLGKLISSGSGGKVNVEVDDYLHAVVSLVNELARFAVVSVIAGNYEMPVAINQFIDDIFTNFQLLNLKNDSLRRRFDSIKYDAKKVEEVVYNLKLRKLIA